MKLVRDTRAQDLIEYALLTGITAILASFAMPPVYRSAVRLIRKIFLFCHT